MIPQKMLIVTVSHMHHNESSTQGENDRYPGIGCVNHHTLAPFQMVPGHSLAALQARQLVLVHPAYTKKHDRDGWGKGYVMDGRRGILMQNNKMCVCNFNL